MELIGELGAIPLIGYAFSRHLPVEPIKKETHPPSPPNFTFLARWAFLVDRLILPFRGDGQL